MFPTRATIDIYAVKVASSDDEGHKRRVVQE